ncbi:MAG: hypothetical protein ABIO55_00785 [Ginsengibacter sp.]
MSRYCSSVSQVREKFKGKIRYASLPYEGVDWSLFDFIATDGGYRSAAIAPYFQKGIQTLVSLGKPVGITEFGCAAYRGAADAGARADWIIEWYKPLTQSQACKKSLSADERNLLFL